MRWKIWMVGCALWSAVPVFAQSVTFVTGNDYAPFTDESLPQRGMLTELIERTVQEMGLKPEVKFLPWKRGYEDALHGKFLGTFPYIHTDERAQDFLFSTPLYQVANRIFVAKDSPLVYEKPEDLIGKRACAVLGGAHPKPLQVLIDAGKISVEHPKDLASCFKMLELQRADFISINELNGWGTVRQNFPDSDGFKVIGPPVEMVGQFLLVNRQDPQGPAFLEKFNQALESLRKKEVAREIVDRHLKAFLGR